MLRGAIWYSRHAAAPAFLRFFACEEHLHQSPDALLPDAVGVGKEPFTAIRAIAAGSAEVSSIHGQMVFHRSRYEELEDGPGPLIS